MKKRLLLMIIAIMIGITGITACSSQPKPSETTGEKDAVTGLLHEGQLELEYAKSFTVDYYEKGIKKYTDTEAREVWLVPQGEMESFPKDLNTIQIPVQSIAILSTVDAPMLRAVGEMDKIVATTTKADRWHIPQIKEGMESGAIKYLGSKNSLDYEGLEQLNPDVILYTYENLERNTEIVGKFTELGSKWIGMTNHKENDPRARLEWIKLMGELTGKEAQAKEYFDQEIEKIHSIEEMSKNKTDLPTFATTFMFKDLFYVRNAGDYNPKMMEIAGGEYIFSDLNPEADGNTKMNAEEFYKGAENVDILIYDTISGSDIQTKEDLVLYAPYLADIKAVHEGRIWSPKPNYFQSSDHVADMIADLHKIFVSPPGEITETEYFYQLKER